jgi:hypothetical protein
MIRDIYCDKHIPVPKPDPEPRNYTFTYHRLAYMVSVETRHGKTHMYDIHEFVRKFINPIIIKKHNVYGLTEANIKFFLDKAETAFKDKPKPDPKAKPRPPLKGEPEMLLANLGICSRKTYKLWCVTNHPDKVQPEKYESATELFKKISVLVDQYYP